jgi:hypothetical protein
VRHAPVTLQLLRDGKAMTPAARTCTKTTWGATERTRNRLRDHPRSMKVILALKVRGGDPLMISL